MKTTMFFVAALCAAGPAFGQDATLSYSYSYTYEHRERHSAAVERDNGARIAQLQSQLHDRRMRDLEQDQQIRRLESRVSAVEGRQDAFDAQAANDRRALGTLRRDLEAHRNERTEARYYYPQYYRTPSVWYSYRWGPGGYSSYSHYRY